MLKTDFIDSRLTPSVTINKPIDVAGSVTSDSLKTDILDTKNDTKIVSNKPIHVDTVRSKLGAGFLIDDVLKIKAGVSNIIAFLTSGISANRNITIPDRDLTIAGVDEVIGVNQTWQDVTASRALATLYTNSTGKPITVSIYLSLGAGQGCSFTIDGVVRSGYGNIGGSATAFSLENHIIPNGSSYKAEGGASITRWSELR